MKWWLVAVFWCSVALCGGIFQNTASALSLEIRPLQYTTTLAKGEKQKGYIDVTNPTKDSVHIRTEVQAFRQVDDRGSLQFYDNERLAAGIVPDLSEFDLGAGETIRMYFLLDGTKLPSGDTFGALFFRIVPTKVSGMNSSLRLGTLFSIENMVQTDHRAEVTDLSVPFLQFDSQIHGTYSVLNTADPLTTNAFHPQVKLTVEPFTHSLVSTSGLVFAGQTRKNDFSIDSSRFGLYTVTLEYNGKRMTKVVFAAAYWWLWLAGLVILTAIVGGFLLWRNRHKARVRRYTPIN